ncbi:pilus (MSHA type) biogenesis protein MshL [Methylophilus sp. Leaf416]|uniref:pilus (MSHA type) biogenesis protein MshL n=2 Tax=unclassified Methylophilus TaxID=2630143 RepID=UPI000A7F8075|nr:pilus (MSHA type) biogenesis protein MshL [Methylophilus sp. Leaf416]
MRLAAMLLMCFCLISCVSRGMQEAKHHSELHLPELNPDLPDSTPLHVYPEVETTDVEAQVITKPPLKSASPTLLVNLVVQEAPVQEVLQALARESHMNMDIHPGLRGKVSLHAIQQSIPAILSRIARQVDMYYEWGNGVWLIAPDMPVLRSYRLNYVNMTRDTTGFIGVASEINSAGRPASGSAQNNSNASTQSQVSGAGNSNSSRTAVATQSRYHLWESVVQNLQILLEETDKATIARDEVSESAVSLFSSIPAEIPEAGDLPRQSVESLNTQPPQTSSKSEKTQQAHVRWRASRLIANPETGILTIRASHSQQAQVKSYLESVMQVAARQVLIEATIVEVELSKSFQMGIDWSRLSSSAQQRGVVFSQSLGSEAAQFNTTSRSFESNNSKNALGQNNGSVAFMFGYFNPFSRFGNLSASVTLLEQFGKTRVLSSPKLMVLNNQTAILKVVDNLVYFTIQSQISQSSSNNGANLQAVTTTANTVPVGLVMAVTAQINSQKRVNLNVRPTVSKVLRYIEDPNPQLGNGSTRIVSSIPEIQVREMESVLNIPSGNVAILGGLMQEDQRDFTDRVPGLANIPIVGYAFKGKNQAAKKTELVVFLRPTVIGLADVKAGDLKAFEPLLPESLPMDDIDFGIGEPS